VAPVIVDPDDIKNSAVKGSAIPVSFAKVIGTGYSSGSNPGVPTGAYQYGIFGTTTATGAPTPGGGLGSWATIATNEGFPKPGTASGSGASIAVGPNVDDKEEFFYVNVGMTDVVQSSLKFNKGTYTETFNFELIADF